jgi:TonB family protein
MKLLTGKRLGQSRGELATAVLFSLLIHVITVAGALFLSFSLRPRVFIPPFYRVNLVDLPQDLPLLPPSASTQPMAASAPPAPMMAAPREAPRPKQAGREAPSPRPAAAPKGAMPELDAGKQAKEHVAEDAPPRPETGPKQDTVAVTSASSEFRFPPYVAIVRDKVERNWNPPPGAKGVKVKVMFKILRSGRVGDARLVESSGNFYFDQAAMRAILSSSPFPPLPEGFFRESESFSVDLMERE